MRCRLHKFKNKDEILGCEDCLLSIDKVKKYQKHNHTFTCAKKKKVITIKETEGLDWELLFEK